MKGHSQLRSLVTASILCALVVVMTVIPYTGYINYGSIEITTLHIVTILAGVLLGWKYGAVVGGVWGLSCIVRCLVAFPIYKPFGFANLFVAFLPRVCVGIVAGLLFDALKKTSLNRSVAIGASAIGGSLTNTVLVLSAMTVFCKRHGVEGYELANVFTTIQSIIASLAALNGILEIIAAAVLVPAIYFVLQPKETVLGIDFGASATKLALVRKGRCLRAILKKDDESLEDALKRIDAVGVKKCVITGVGASYITEDIAGIPTERADEFKSLCRGVVSVTGKRNCLVVSVGTGTSFVRVTPVRSWHVGGTGIGGRTLKSLGKLLTNETELEALKAMAASGRLENVDLVLKDVCSGTISNLREDSTVANLAKLETASVEDKALGLFNMIFQTIGIMAAFAVKKHATRTIVVVGTITEVPVARNILDTVGYLHNVKFIVAEHAPFITAIGAAQE